MTARHHEVSRLEGFSDAVFGFALALLVVSMETPDNVGDLLQTALGFVPFALTFAMVCWIWYGHNTFFRQYGLQDAWTVFLNAVLLFVVLFYVYPLKYLAAMLVNMLVGGPTNFGTHAQSRMLMLIYSAGVVLIFGSFVLLYRHAWRNRRALELSPIEETSLIYDQRSHMLSMSVGLVSVAIVLVGVVLNWMSGGTVSANWAAPIGGIIYFAMGPLHAWNGNRAGKALEAARNPPPVAPPEPGDADE